MAAINDGGPAFPQNWEEGDRAQFINPGMSLRDWFAGQALAGLVPVGNPMTVNNRPVAIEQAAYILADAMLAERAKGTK